MNGLIIAIDGPAGAGKSTVARIVAGRLRYTYLDTGAMYRAVTWAVTDRGISLEDEARIAETAQGLDLSLTYHDEKTEVKVNGTDITEAIRTPEISRAVSEVAKFAGVRTAMVGLQRQLASLGGVVLDGRDIGSHVLPNANVKVFLTASIEERARRRHEELKEKGYDVSFEELCHDIAERDRADSEREISPLVQADDAVLLDTTKLTIDEVVEAILKICEEKLHVL